MINQLRKIVGGPKNRTVCEGYDLDFTYISDTVAAMAYPASGLQQTYRNSIHEVAEYLKQKHNSNYLIINVSNRKYDYQIFNDKVIEYIWQDHQAPTLDVLFEVAYDSFLFLKDNHSNGIVCFHCNHGKGRTGTAIICLFIFCGFFNNIDEALKFYNKRRFKGENYGVSQPCQLRYMDYFLLALWEINNNKYQPKIKSYKLTRIQIQGLNLNQYDISLLKTRDQQPLLKKISLCQKQMEIKGAKPMFSDIYIEVIHKGWVKNTIAARANVNLNFGLYTNDKQFRWVMESQKVRTSKSHTQKFAIYFYFMPYCECHLKQNPQCACVDDRKVQQAAWDKIIKYCREKDKYMLNNKQMCKLLFPTHYSELKEEEQLIKQTAEKAQQIQKQRKSSDDQQN